MEFRPCIDIHNGKVKQIVGSSLRDAGDQASENFVSGQDAAFYARMYQSRGIRGGHIILLNAKDSPYYEKTKNQALAALRAYPGGLQVGGGITDANASEFLEAGASAVIVTSFVFRDGRIDYDCLNRLEQAVGKEHLVLDLSCRYRADAEEPGYYIVTDRWQKFTTERVTNELLEKLFYQPVQFLSPELSLGPLTHQNIHFLFDVTVSHTSIALIIQPLRCQQVGLLPLASCHDARMCIILCMCRRRYMFSVTQHGK
jgi:phosphoribosylformimino-5-aminoimidazole carboxamide ribotide isomerase